MYAYAITFSKESAALPVNMNVLLWVCNAFKSKQQIFNMLVAIENANTT